MVWTPVETCTGIFCAYVVPTAPLYSALLNKFGLRRARAIPQFYQTPKPAKGRSGQRLDSEDDDMTNLHSYNMAALANPGSGNFRPNPAASQWESVVSKVTTDHSKETNKTIPMNAIDVESGLEWKSERI